MNYFKSFQRRTDAKIEAEKVRNTAFIYKGYPSIKITNASKEIQACVVNKQESDIGYIYTQKNDELPIGSIWQAKNLHFLIDEEITIIKDVNFRKYHCILCNTPVNDTWGFFLGPKKVHISDVLRKGIMIDTMQNPILVLPSNTLKYGDKISIKDRGWQVTEYDNISTPGITYYSIEAATISKATIADHTKDKVEEPVYVEPVQESRDKIFEPKATTKDDVVTFTPGQELTVSTTKGYFKSTCPLVKITKHTATEVGMVMPAGIKTFTITTRAEDGTKVDTKFSL